MFCKGRFSEMRACLKSGSIILAAAGLVAALGVSSPALSAPAPERLPACETPSVLRAAMARIATADKDYRNGITIHAIGGVSQTAYREPLGSPYAQRYCSGLATLSNGRQQTVYFRVAEGRGFLGQTWGVQACLPGLDKWHVYDGKCKAIRP